MNKQMHRITLTGMVDGLPAKTHQANDVVYFVANGPKGTPDYFTVDNTVEGTPTLITPKGQYDLVWSRSGQYYEPKHDMGVKLHVTLKKITGQLIYWA